MNVNIINGEEANEIKMWVEQGMNGRLKLGLLTTGSSIDEAFEKLQRGWKLLNNAHQQEVKK